MQTIAIIINVNKILVYALIQIKKVNSYCMCWFKINNYYMPYRCKNNHCVNENK